MDDVETVNHVFFSCNMAKDLWALFAKWRELDIPVCANISEWFDALHISNKVRKFIEGVGGTLLWYIWKFINELIFTSPPSKKATLWDSIVSHSFLWISSRNPNLCKTRTFALGDKPNSFFAPEGKPPRRGLNPRPLACGNNLPKDLNNNLVLGIDKRNRAKVINMDRITNLLDKSNERGVETQRHPSSIEKCGHELMNVGFEKLQVSLHESKRKAIRTGDLSLPKSKVAAVVSEKLIVVNESVVKSIEKSTVVKERDVTSKVGKSNVSAVVSEKLAVDEKDNPKVSKVSDESNKAAVVAPVIEKVPVSTETDKETEPVVVADVKVPVVAAVESVIEKDNPKVTSKVLDESVKAPVIKESVKVPVVKKSVKASSVVTDKPSSVVADKVDVVVKKSVKASSVVADKPSSVVADKVDVVVKKSVKASSVVADKPSSIVADKVDVVKDKVDVVADKASDALKNKPTGKGKKPVVGKDKNTQKNIAPNVVKEKFKPNPRQKVISSEIPVL
nr:reverse transcriptase domain, reverse transcriptase zinc-binding domain protein [Tanacetum cinerariifolium]GEW49863.1 reverse transcriptase domain, reverse transcriptase zinc-binding domain protein [Tanacetum cinerariifolium]